jgi:hypothetical protein
MNRIYFLALAATLIFSGCHNNPTDDAPPARQENIIEVQVAYDGDVLPLDDTDNCMEGGCFELADAPEGAITYAPAGLEPGTSGYTMIDPKRDFRVLLIAASGHDTEASVNDFEIIVEYKESGTYVTKEDTRLDKLGEARLVVKYKKRPEINVYYKRTGIASSQTPFEILVANRDKPDPSAVFKGFTVHRNPFKMKYDWQEPFDPAGMEVVRWFGGDGPSLTAGSTPVRASIADYLVDTFNYAALFVNPSNGIPMAASEGEQTVEIWIKSPPTGDDVPALTGDVTDAATDATFDITMQAVKRKVKAEILAGDGYLQEVNTDVLPTQPATLTLKRNNGSTDDLNPETVKVRYGDVEVTPLPPGTGGKNAINLRWDSTAWQNGAVKPEGDNGTWRLTYTMPMADITVYAEFVKASSKLQTISVATTKSDVPLFGFNPNISTYTYIVQNDVDAVWVACKNSSGGYLSPSENGRYFVDGSSVTDGDYFKITGFPEGDTVVTIAPDSSGKLYKVVIKKMTAGGLVNFDWADGLVQTFYPPVAGNYKFEAWGAFGGDAPNYDGGGGDGRGGWGGYSAGTIAMDPERDYQWDPNDVNNSGGGVGKGLKVAYIYVGEGGYSRSGQNAGKATWNGGGAGGMGGAFGAGSGGGGATSVSLTRGAWSDWQVLIDRIMVAGGGGGYGHNKGRAGNAAGFVGQGGRIHSGWNGNLNDANPATGYLGGQVTGGWWTSATQRPGSGRGGQGFGIGGKGPNPPGWGGCGAEGRGGGGGGYFGGEPVWNATGANSNSGGGGGSGYVSGYAVGEEHCISYNPISKEGWMVPKGALVPGSASSAWSDPGVEDHYSGYEFTDGVMNKLQSTSSGNKGGNNTYVDGTWQAHPKNPGNAPLGLVGTGQKNLDGYFRVTLLTE